MKFEDFWLICNVGTEGKFELRLGFGGLSSIVIGLFEFFQKIIEKDFCDRCWVFKFATTQIWYI